MNPISKSTRMIGSSISERRIRNNPRLIRKAPIINPARKPGGLTGGTMGGIIGGKIGLGQQHPPSLPNSVIKFSSL